MGLYLKYNIILILIILFLLFNSFIKEGFQNPQSVYSDDLIKRFLEFQNTVNQNDHQYNLKVLQQQATPEEVEHLLKTGYWPWSNETKYLYMDAVFHNKIIKIEPGVALNYAMKVYNENAVKKLLSWNTKEGQFLLYGALLGKKTDPSYNLIKCDGTDMKKYTYYASNGYLLPTETTIENKDIPKELPGFSFYKNICNPCNVFKDDGLYNCPFIIQTSSKEHNISTIWRKLWNI